MENYDKMAIVGRGAFGIVYLCRKDSGEKVVMKQIIIGHMDEQELEATIQEVKIMSQIDHPHVIKYFDSFIDCGALTIIMEFATKGTLQDFLQKQKSLLSEKVILNFLVQLCLALKYIHSKKILHRDITTTNILLTGSHGHNVKLSDFGISKVLTNRTKTFSVVGTPCYLSPELCEGKPYGTHSDVWALGCVLYNMCTLSQAFQAKALASLVMKILHGAISPIDPMYDCGLMEILRLMLDRDPLNRPSASAILSHRLLVPELYNIITSHGCQWKQDNSLQDQEGTSFCWETKPQHIHSK